MDRFEVPTQISTILYFYSFDVTVIEKNSCEKYKILTSNVRFLVALQVRVGDFSV